MNKSQQQGILHEYDRVSARIERLKSGDWSFGHAGMHHGNGAKDCPRTLHHHHDPFCEYPSPAELRAAGINPEEFKARDR